MKLFLVGYPGSQIIRKASKYLVKKYLPEFKIKYICHKASTRMWGYFLASILRQHKDKYVMFALDDYLLNNKLSLKTVNLIVDMMEKRKATVTKLCECSDIDNREYPVTTQYCVWNREDLINILSRITDPWDFEIRGSKLFIIEHKVFLHYPALHYHTNSCLSSRWEGIDFKGVREEDLELVKQLCT